MDELRGIYQNVGYIVDWVDTANGDIVWRAVLDQGGQTVGWPSGRFSAHNRDKALVPTMVRLAVEGHVQASLACLGDKKS